MKSKFSFVCQLFALFALSTTALRAGSELWVEDFGFDPDLHLVKVLKEYRWESQNPSHKTGCEIEIRAQLHQQEGEFVHNGHSTQLDDSKEHVLFKGFISHLNEEHMDEHKLRWEMYFRLGTMQIKLPELNESANRKQYWNIFDLNHSLIPLASLNCSQEKAEILLCPIEGLPDDKCSTLVILTRNKATYWNETALRTPETTSLRRAQNKKTYFSCLDSQKREIQLFLNENRNLAHLMKNQGVSSVWITLYSNTKGAVESSTIPYGVSVQEMSGLRYLGLAAVVDYDSSTDVDPEITSTRGRCSIVSSEEIATYVHLWLSQNNAFEVH